MPDRSVEPAAHIRAEAEFDSLLPGARRADELVATEEIPTVPITGTGVERPVPEWVEVSQSLFRVFAFVDVCGFTSFTDRHGTHAAIEVLTRFRSAARDVTGRRGVRVLKWLGDGVMLVGVEAGPVIAAVAELLLRFRDDEFDIHGGIAGGTVLLFEGDDYIGRPVNLAARLCEAAGPSEVLIVGLEDALPDWVSLGGSVIVRALGIGDIAGVAQLKVSDEAWATSTPLPHHPSALSDHEGLV